MSNQDIIKSAGEIRQLPVKFDAEALIAKGIEHNLPVDTMERLLAMRAQLKAEAAREAFFQALSAFQAECPVIPKDKVATVYSQKGQYQYRYAELATIGKTIAPLLKAYGLSYRFNTAFQNDPPSQVVTCIVQHIDGHSETSEFRSPIDAGARMNEIQKSASAQTYGKRYALANALGILTGDEDDDAQSIGMNCQDYAPPSRPPQKSAKPKPITHAQHKKMEALIAETGLDREAVREWFIARMNGEDVHLNAVPDDLYRELVPDRLQRWGALEGMIRQQGLKCSTVMDQVAKTFHLDHLADLSQAQADKLAEKLIAWGEKKRQAMAKEDQG